MKKKIWMRLGVSIELTEDELKHINTIVRNKVENGEFVVDGDSYIPANDGDEDHWPVKEINFDF